MVELDITAPALEIIRGSFVGAGWALFGGLAWMILFWLVLPTVAGRHRRGTPSRPLVYPPR